jgi:hypothetical protein
VWLGGTPNQTELARTYQEKVKAQDFEKVLEPILATWKEERKEGESFGVFVNRVVSRGSACFALRDHLSSDLLGMKAVFVPGLCFKQLASLSLPVQKARIFAL